jgi:hypothetical protein
MKFRVSFIVDEGALGPVLAAVHPIGIEQLAIDPVAGRASIPPEIRQQIAQQGGLASSAARKANGKNHSFGKGRRAKNGEGRTLLLNILKEKGAMRPGEIAQYFVSLGGKGSSAANALHLLRKEGLVQKTPGGGYRLKESERT